VDADHPQSRRVRGLTALALALAGLAGPAAAQDVHGTVFEVVNHEAPRAEWRRTPAASAFVIVHWTGRRPGFGHYESVCIQAAIARTDERGRFQIAEPSPLRSTFLVLRDEPAVGIFKPGFDAPSELRKPGAQPEWSLLPTRLTREQRASVADGLSRMGCSDDQGGLLPMTDPQAVLPAYRDALREESATKPPPARQVRVLPRSQPLPAGKGN